MGLSLRFRAALWLPPLLLHFVYASAGLADPGCDGWTKLSLAQKRKSVENSFSKQSSWGAHEAIDDCLRNSASRMATEITASCREGRPLEESWGHAGLAWTTTCTVIAARVASGAGTGATQRLEMRADFEECALEGRKPAECRKRLVARYLGDLGGSGQEAECRGFIAMPRNSKLAEIEDRIHERFSSNPDIARCMRTGTSAILREVESLCRGGDDASTAWDQVLRLHTDRCLDRDTGL